MFSFFRRTTRTEPAVDVPSMSNWVLSAEKQLTDQFGEYNYVKLKTMRVDLERLSSGLRVNSAKDDAAGLATVERMKYTQVCGMNIVIRKRSRPSIFVTTSRTSFGAVQSLFESEINKQ